MEPEFCIIFLPSFSLKMNSPAQSRSRLKRLTNNGVMSRPA